MRILRKVHILQNVQWEGQIIKARLKKGCIFKTRNTGLFHGAGDEERMKKIASGKTKMHLRAGASWTKNTNKLLILQFECTKSEEL
ncbi:hypothetical protein MKW98_021435 [Papaver atlanticum]|uniref:Uncharacterized protein n=1 Tax=Papaver atlanticum TaxID=357466 RepID=A0AAD4SRT4_9MAGN|nr:hypothetical protein MKW98_021435 [Papaver atlanticum]